MQPTTNGTPLLSTSTRLPIHSSSPLRKCIVVMVAGFPSTLVTWVLTVLYVPGARLFSGSASCFQRTRLAVPRPSQSLPAGPAISRSVVPCTLVSNTYCLQSELTNWASAGTKTDASQHCVGLLQ